MTLRVVFRRAARAEFDAAASWYEERQIGLGATFTSEIKRAVELASNHPERFPVKCGAIRCAPVGVHWRYALHLDSICRTAVYVIRSYGGVGGGSREASPYIE